MGWMIVFAGMAIGAIAGLIYLWTRFQKFGIVKKLAGDSKLRLRLLAAIPLLGFVIVSLFGMQSLVNAVIVMVHMAVYWFAAELIAKLIRRIRKKEKQPDTKRFQPYLVGILVLCIEAAYFTTGWILAHHVWEKDYQVTAEKDLGMERLRIAQIADAHIGVTFDGEGFAKHLEEIQACEPDLLVITGDFVDDDTDKEDMFRSCLALAGFRSKYGVFFVYGNHDKGYFDYRNFTSAELETALRAAGVTILQDEVQLIDNKFYIVGRQDKSVKDRVPIGKILSVLDPSKYTIVLDHQPNDYEAEAAAGADLVLSGHSHGGQMIIMKIIGALTGSNDQTYGMETRDKTTFIVTSGLSDWALKFKTGTNSEFVIIDVTS